MADCVAAGVDGVELVATVCCLLAADTVDEDGAGAGAGARMAAGNLTLGFVWIVSLLGLGCTAAGVWASVTGTVAFGWLVPVSATVDAPARSGLPRLLCETVAV